MTNEGLSMPELVFRGRKVTRDRGLIMAIVNRTPDSFYDHGATFADTAAKDAIHLAVREGADVIDIGGIPASPGPEVTIAEEIARIVPTIEWIRETYPDAVISADTWRAEAADAACQAGTDLINDTWAGFDREVIDVAAQYGAGYVCTHVGGLLPRTDPIRPQYEDVVKSVVDGTTELAEYALSRGIPREGIMVDPTLDFGKNTYHSLAVLRDIDTLVATGWPVLMSMSNKGFVGETLDVPLDDRVIGTLASTAYAANAGAAMFRAHQVRETRQVLEMTATINGIRPPANAVRWI
jgi:dihydropteroate synthase